MNKNDIGCFGWLVMLTAIALAAFRIYAIFSADIPMWLKWFLVG